MRLDDRLKQLEEKLKQHQQKHGDTGAGERLRAKLDVIARNMAGFDTVSVADLSPAERLATGQIDPEFISYWRRMVANEVQRYASY